MRETLPQPSATDADSPSGSHSATGLAGTGENLAALKPRPNSGASRWRFGSFSGLGNSRARVASPINLFRLRHVRLS